MVSLCFPFGFELLSMVGHRFPMCFNLSLNDGAWFPIGFQMFPVMGYVVLLIVVGWFLFVSQVILNGGAWFPSVLHLFFNCLRSWGRAAFHCFSIVTRWWFIVPFVFQFTFRW